MSGRKSLPCLPWRPVTHFLSFRFSNNFLGLKNRVALKLFTVLKYFFIFQDFWGTCACPEKQCALILLYWIHIFNHSEFWTNCACPAKQSLPRNFSRHWNIFYLSGFLRCLRLPWKQSLSWHLRCISYIFYIQDVWTTFACPEKQSVPWIHCICIFEFTWIRIFIIQNFEQFALAVKNRVALKFFTVLNIAFTFRMFEQLCLPWKTECALNSLYWIYIFIIQNFEQPAPALRNIICLEDFHCIEILFIFHDFWATWAYPENRVSPEFFKPGGRLPPHPPASYATGFVTIQTTYDACYVS